MNKLSLPHIGARLLLILALGLTTNPASAKTATTKELIAGLAGALAQAAPGTDQRFARYLDQVEPLLNQGRYAEVEMALTQLKTALPTGNEHAADLMEQLLARVRADAAEAVAKQEAAYDSVVTEFVAKFEAKAPAADFDPLLKRLGTTTVASSYGTAGAQKADMLRGFIARWQDYLLAISRGNTDQAAQALNDLVQQSTRLPILPRSRLSNLLNETSGRLNGRNEVVDARMDALQKQLAATIDSAKGAAGFDAFLAELAKPVPGDGGQGRYNNNGQANQLDSLRRFASRWQDYFSQMESGNVAAAQNTLRELANNGSSTEAIYPRSRILARMSAKDAAPANVTFNVVSAPPAAVAPSEPLIAPQELTADKVEKLFQQLVSRRAGNSLPPGMEDLTTELNGLRNGLAQLKVGNLQAVVFYARSSSNSAGRVGPYAEALATLKADAMMRALPLYFEAPAELQPAKSDTYESYTKKLIEHGKKQKDWPLVYRVLIANQSLSTGGLGTDPDLAGYKYFIAGLQEEKAGLWAQAIRSYMFALATGSPNLPAEEIGDRLKRIKAEHPEDYAKTENLHVTVDPFRPGNVSEVRYNGTTSPVAPSMAQNPASNPPPKQPAGESPPKK